MMRLSKIQVAILIAIIAAVFFIPFLGRVHLFDWDEVNFAECSREMIKMDDYSRVYINFEPFWEKPPMFFWMQSTAMKIFGITEFAARFPNAICGIITLLVVFFCGSKIYDKKFGVLWALAFGGSLFPNMYFKSGIIDPWFNLFTFLSLYNFILYHWVRNGFDKDGLKKRPIYYVLWSGIFMGLAILTKGQVSLMIFLLALGVYFIYNRFRMYFNWWHAILYLIIAAAVTSTWYGYETIKNGPLFVTEFLKYQYRLFTTHDAGQKGFFGYHYIVLLFGCFPASLLAIPSFFNSTYTGRFDKDFKKWMQIFFWVITVLFTLVQSRIIHYSSMAWFPVSFLAANSIYKWDMKQMTYKNYVGVFITVIGGIISLFILSLPYVAMKLKRLAPYAKDKFVNAMMQANVPWSGLEGIVGLLMIISIIIGIKSLAKGKFQKAAWTLFGGTAIVIFLASAIIVPKVERYTQGAAIDFFIERQREDCYVNTLGYFSYAQLFYVKKEKPVNPKSYDEQWLLTGDIDKPAYFVSKVDRIDKYKQYTQLKELYRKNGFIFLKREVNK
jgi:4-amino-4-deoxy-L-arabinose transferase-like glycosyltransferase